MTSSPRLYPTDLSDAEWILLEPLIPSPRPGGRPTLWPRRLILDGIFSVVRSGCQWRLLPNEPSHGWDRAGGYPRTTSDYSRLARRSSISP